MVSLKLLFYNLRVGRSLTRVMFELRVLAALFRPKVLAGCEAEPYALKPIRGYTLIHDRTDPRRANVFAYVRSTRIVTRVKYHDGTDTWKRTERPGIHPARSILEFMLEGIRVIVAHQAPVTPSHDSRASRLWGVATITDRMAPEHRPGFDRRPIKAQEAARWRPEIALADWNAQDGSSGPNQGQVALAIGGRVAGEKIDAAVVRNLEVTGASYVKNTIWGGALFRFLTDHPWGAFVLTVKVDRRWWPKR